MTNRRFLYVPPPYVPPPIDIDALRTHLFFLNLRAAVSSKIAAWGYDDWDAVISSTGTYEQVSRFHGAHCTYDEKTGALVSDTSGILYS